MNKKSKYKKNVNRIRKLIKKRESDKDFGTYDNANAVGA